MNSDVSNRQAANQKFVVLGSNSFSGSHFVDRLLKEGAAVIGISRSREPHTAFLPYKKNPNLAKFVFMKLDLNDDLAAIMEACDSFKPDYFVNFAAQSMVAESWADPDHWFMTNVVSTVRLHEQLRSRKYLLRYVHISTPEVYGSCSGTVTEDAPFNPSTPYAVSRAAADMSLRSYFRQYQFPVVSTRAANVFGPGQQLYRIVPRTALFIRTGRKLELHGGGHSIRSFIHIDDVVDGTLKATRFGKLGDTYHFSTQRQISIRDLVEMICERMGARFSDCVGVVDERPGKDQAYLLDSQKAQRELGWKDKISLEQGIDETIRWIDGNLTELKSEPFNYVHKP